MTIVVLLGLLVASAGIAVWTWQEIGQVEISRHGLVALWLGAVVTFLLGAGLMALVFVSNRRGFDENAHQFRRTEQPEEPQSPDRTAPDDQPPPPDRG